MPKVGTNHAAGFIQPTKPRPREQVSPRGGTDFSHCAVPAETPVPLAGIGGTDSSLCASQAEMPLPPVDGLLSLTLAPANQASAAVRQKWSNLPVFSKGARRAAPLATCPMSGRSRTFSAVATTSFPGSAWERNARGSASICQRAISAPALVSQLLHAPWTPTSEERRAARTIT